MAKFVALLRAINVGKRQVSMAALKALAEEIGLAKAQTYVASGNLVFEADGTAVNIEQQLDDAISARFGFPVETIVRSGAAWPKLVAGNPFPEATTAEPNRVLLFLSKRPPASDAADRIAERAQAGERVEAAPGAIWIHYASGVGASKLTPTLIDKACGSPTTGRNVRTITKLAEMLGQ